MRDDYGINNNNKASLNVSRIFDAPIEMVWRAWSDPEFIKQWWGPAGFSCPLAQIDFREGGTSLVCMKAPQDFGGQEMFNTWTYTKIVPMQEIEYIQAFTDRNGTAFNPVDAGMPAGIPMEVRSHNLYKALNDGKTELTVMEFGFTTDQAIAMSKAGLVQCLDKMEAILSNK